MLKRWLYLGLACVFLLVGLTCALLLLPLLVVFAGGALGAWSQPPDTLRMCGVLLVLACFATIGCWVAWRLNLAYSALAPSDRRPLIRPVECPQCADDDVVRTYGTCYSLKGLWRRAKCLTCGHRFPISAHKWRALPSPQLGDPFETLAERWLTSLQEGDVLSNRVLVLLVLWLTIGLPLAFFIRSSSFVGIWLAGIPCIGAVGCVDAWLFPKLRRRPGHRCVVCAYDLRRCAGSRCPECGTPFDPTVVAAYWHGPDEPDQSGETTRDLQSRGQQ